jgi:hypothetical protein
MAGDLLDTVEFSFIHMPEDPVRGVPALRTVMPGDEDRQIVRQLYYDNLGPSGYPTNPMGPHDGIGMSPT